MDIERPLTIDEQIAEVRGQLSKISRKGDHEQSLVREIALLEKQRADQAIPTDVFVAPQNPQAMPEAQQFE